MDQEGRVLGYHLQRSSGHTVLDDEVLALIDRAQPLPEMGGDPIKLVMPVQFFLR